MTDVDVQVTFHGERYPMSRPALLCVLLAFLAPTALPSADQFLPQAPEWKRCKYKHPLDAQEYRGWIRFVTASSSRNETSGCTPHGLTLDHGGWLNVEEWDSKTGLIVALIGTEAGVPAIQMQFERKLNSNAKPRRHEVRFGCVWYGDLDGDGIIDAWVDSRGSARHSYQLRRMQVVEVGDSKVPFYDVGESVSSDKVPAVREKPKPPALGPEWIRIKTVNPESGHEETSYVRPGANVSYRKDNDDMTRHTVLLDHGGGIDVYERDDKSAITIELIGTNPKDLLFRFRRYVSKNGKPARHEVRFGPVAYYDLDGDGFIDYWVDHRGAQPKSYIVCGDHIVQVEASKGPIENIRGALLRARSDGQKVEYAFTNGKWSAVKP